MKFTGESKQAKQWLKPGPAKVLPGCEEKSDFHNNLNSMFVEFRKTKQLSLYDLVFNFFHKFKFLLHFT